MLDSNSTPNEPTGIHTVHVEDEMRKSYLDYAMSVIVSRALPDVRDGLKPVHRRILYAMHEGGYHWNRPFKKSARIVGDVMGNYHPHGDGAIYDAMVRMAQPFSMRLPLVMGQGNFGSMDGDPPAAMRYTEAKLSKAAHQLLSDIDLDTVDFQPNYDESQSEPLVLPARFPNLLVNGAGGIAVGMATNIPPHNLGEVIDACCALIDNPDLTSEDLHVIVPGPDFPTGGLILGRKGSRDACLTGRGSVIMRSKTHFEEKNNKDVIVVTETPYQVNKSKLIERIAELVKEKVIEGISDLRDESDKDGVRIVVELKRDAAKEVVLNLLFKHTALQTSFGVNTLALDHGQPKLLNLKEILESFIIFREEVITRRTNYKLNKARNRAHVLVGLSVAVENIDPVISLIKKAGNPTEACEQLMTHDWQIGTVGPMIRLAQPSFDPETTKTYKLSEAQAKAILDLKLHRLTGLEREKIVEDLSEIVKKIEGYLNILNNRSVLYELLRGELVEIKEEFATPRRSIFEEGEFETDIEDLIQREDMVVTVTHGGYIKRVPLSTYRAQRRGGKGRSGMATRDEDFLRQVFMANTHTPVLFFTSKGIVFKLKTYRLPIGSPQSRGKALVNILPLDEGETITAVMPLPEEIENTDDHYIMFSTASGNVRRNKLSDFTSVKANGKIAMKLEEGDKLIGVNICQENETVLISTRNGKSIRFPVSAIRVFVGRNSVGVRGISLKNKDRVVSMCVLHLPEFSIEERDSYIKVSNQARRNETDPDFTDVESLTPEKFESLQEKEDFILSVTENGFGKRTSAYEYRITNRGGQGIVNIETSERNGNVVGSFPVFEDDQLLLVTDQGKIIRCPVHDIRIAGRATQGVTLFKVADNEKVVSVSRLTDLDGDEEEDMDAEESHTTETEAVSEEKVTENQASSEEEEK